MPSATSKKPTSPAPEAGGISSNPVAPMRTRATEKKEVLAPTGEVDSVSIPGRTRRVGPVPEVLGTDFIWRPVNNGGVR